VATGNLGRAAIEGIVSASELELVAAVHAAEKAGATPASSPGSRRSACARRATSMRCSRWTPRCALQPLLAKPRK